MATNPTFFTDYAATTDHVSETASAQTEIASATYDWGVGTKANIVAGAGARWEALPNVWTDPNNWTVVVVAKPAETRVGAPSQVFTLADSGGSYLFVSFFGDYASGEAGTESFAAIHYKSRSFRRGGFTASDVCDGNAHVYIARMSGGVFQTFRDDLGEVAATSLTVSTAKLTGTTTTPSLHCSGTYSSSTNVNRQAPVGLVKFYNEALSDADVAALLADPWETGGATDATADGGTGTGIGSGTGGNAVAGSADATADGGTGTGTGSGSGGDAVSTLFVTAPNGAHDYARKRPVFLSGSRPATTRGRRPPMLS